jgi:hypothetical protein
LNVLFELDLTYITASGAFQAKRPGLDSVVEWWFDAPAIIPLLVATALFEAVYMWLNSLDQAPQ